MSSSPTAPPHPSWQRTRLLWLALPLGATALTATLASRPAPLLVGETLLTSDTAVVVSAVVAVLSSLALLQRRPGSGLGRAGRMAVTVGLCLALLLSAASLVTGTLFPQHDRYAVLPAAPDGCRVVLKEQHAFLLRSTVRVFTYADGGGIGREQDARIEPVVVQMVDRGELAVDWDGDEATIIAPGEPHEPIATIHCP